MSEHRGYSVGDKILVVDAEISFDDYTNGDILTITGFRGNYGVTVDIENSAYLKYSEFELHESVNSYIQIDKALLPEVTNDEGMAGTLRVGVDAFCVQSSELAMNFAYQYLAMAEHLKVKEAKMNELDERRNTILKEHNFINDYNDVAPPTKSLVNALIAAEDNK